MYSKQVINPELLNKLAHDAKHVLSFGTLRKYRDSSDRSRSLTFHLYLSKCHRSELCKACPAILVQSIRAKIQEVNSKLFNHLQQIKDQKLQQLIGPQITCDLTLESRSTVVTIPENLPLSDSEKSVLSKSLNFVSISKKLDEFSVKQDVICIWRQTWRPRFQSSEPNLRYLV